MVEVKNVEKKLGTFTLNNVNFDIPKGYICGMIGENGAGKTSIIKILLNLYHPEKGSVKLFGMDYEKDEIRIKDRIGYVLNEDILNGGLTVDEQGEVIGKYYSEYSKDRFKALLDEYGLDHTKKIFRLSKGEKLKLQYVFALSHNPELLILDEPTGNFDPEFRDRFTRSLTEFVSDGEHSVLLATHLTSELDRFGDYIIYVHKGMVKFSSDKEALCDRYAIIKDSHVKLDCLKKEAVIWREDTEFGSKALIYRDRIGQNRIGFKMEIPTIEEIMYGISKKTEKGDETV